MVGLCFWHGAGQFWGPHNVGHLLKVKFKLCIDDEILACCEYVPLDSLPVTLNVLSSSSHRVYRMFVPYVVTLACYRFFVFIMLHECPSSDQDPLQALVS